MSRSRGAAAVPFIMALPIFLLVVAALVQWALIANAQVLVDHAAQAAARSAVTALPEGHPEKVASAACLALAPLSPVATVSTTPEATSMYDALTALAPGSVGSSFPARYTYVQAQEALEPTLVTCTPVVPLPPGTDYPQLAGRAVDVTVTYRFRLTVPGAMKFVGVADTVAGISGQFLTMTSTCRVQTSPGRQAGVNANGSGWPE